MDLAVSRLRSGGDRCLVYRLGPVPAGIQRSPRDPCGHPGSDPELSECSKSNACSNRIRLLERVFIYVCSLFLAPRSLSVLLATAW